MSLVMWILTTLAALLMMSVPAFMIHEDVGFYFFIYTMVLFLFLIILLF